MGLRNRVPTVTQITQTECGLCVAIALLGWYGRHEELTDAREFLDAGRDGVSMQQIVGYLRMRNMQVKLVRAKSPAALAEFSSPLILHWDRSHFVVLERFDGTRGIIMDPAVGRRRVTVDEIEEKASGALIWAVPDEGFERLPHRAFAEWRKVRLTPAGTMAGLLMIGVLSLVSYLALLGVPILTRWLIDNQDDRSALTISLIVAALAALYFLIQLLRVRVLASVMETVGSSLMVDVFARLLRLPYKFFSSRQPGELLFRLNSVNVVRDIITTRVTQGVLDLGTLVVVGLYFFYVDWQVAVIANLMLIANLTAALSSRRRLIELVDEEISHVSNSNTMQLDAVVSIPSVRLGCYEDHFIDRWKQTFDKSLHAMRHRLVLQDGLLGGFLATMGAFGPVLLLIFSLMRVGSGAMTLGDAVSVQMIGATYLSFVNSISGAYTQFAEASRYMARINEIVLSEPEPTGGARVAMPAASVALRHVDFRFSQHSPLVLKDISLDVNEGERIAIVGVSGSGKSTLARIIATLYEPGDGRIYYGNRLRTEYQLQSLRSQIGFVPQENHIHNRSLFENLTLGKDIDRESVLAMCAEVGLDSLIESLPMGLDTPVTEMGANFSGGQRQRIAIARTLLQEPRILVLDEATASLDSVNEHRIVDYLRRCGTTQIVIAHRLATIRDADRIVVLFDGEVVESGTHQELMALDGHYAELYSRDLAQSARAPVQLGETA